MARGLEDDEAAIHNFLYEIPVNYNENPQRPEPICPFRVDGKISGRIELFGNDKLEGERMKGATTSGQRPSECNPSAKLRDKRSSSKYPSRPVCLRRPQRVRYNQSWRWVVFDDRRSICILGNKIASRDTDLNLHAGITIFEV